MHSGQQTKSRSEYAISSPGPYSLSLQTFILVSQPSKWGGLQKYRGGRSHEGQGPGSRIDDAVEESPAPSPTLMAP